MSDTLSKMKMKRNITLICVFLILSALIAYTALNPDPEEEKIQALKAEMLSKNPGEMTREERGEMRKMVDKLSPDTRKKLIREVMKGRLEQMREETSSMTLEQKQERVYEAVEKMKQRFSKMNDEQRAQARERMNSPEGKQSMKEALDFFYTEFTPQERKLLDPIVEEFTIQMGR